MIRSMTGFGRSRSEGPLGRLEAEARCTNGRFFKLYAKLPPEFLALEHRIERVCRQHVRRGSIDLYLRFSPGRELAGAVVDRAAAARYAAELKRLAEELHLDSALTLETLASLPGVVDAGALSEAQIEQLWPAVQQTVADALARAAEMRQSEGQALDRALRGLLEQAATRVDAIAEQAPQVAADYRERVRERLTAALADSGRELDDSDLLHEVALFVERSDMTEEVDRFRSHLAQFQAALTNDNEMGKRLEFLVQELHREANTMGAKAGDARLGEQIVELKTLVERIREQVMNVE